MMEIQQPDVSYSDRTVAGAYDPEPTAVPLFIGYTEKGATYVPIAVNSYDDYTTAFGGNSTSDSVLSYAVQHYFDNGGQGGFVLSLGDYSVLATITPSDLITAFSDVRIRQAVQQELTITLAAIPDTVLLADTDTANWAQAWNALLEICRSRDGVFGLFDCPDAPTNATTCLESFLALTPDHPEWGAAYWPRLVSNYRDANQTPIVLPPSAAIAGAMTTTDRQYGTWRAPANVPLANVIKPTQSWLASDGLFQQNGASLNLIRSFVGRGIRIWGCRTLIADTASPWVYVQVRRLVAYVETQVSEIGQHFVFEPNNALTWIRFRGLVHIFLRELWMDGGLYGAEETDAFYVQIGLDESMTQDDIDQGRMIMKIGLAVAYPAEFIDVSVTFNAGVSVMPTDAGVDEEWT
ncbi:phage tail sheath C-terminal domain-containing protein [Pararobbsia silviterrae]|uniref:Phage tail sheath family protein n=1 Tax=Pararobbsia silviterrae TaxID=1792498 RepID=A0A494Y6M0_9BURK|nr:phage tail sheath C-terminal domain-containing protein [Pararobbsia silviterrae]RKP55966.1 phage tail sheath family protein [Pararobbsia silviterrae]